MSTSPVYTVAEINQQVRTLLLENFSEVIVRGEISGLKQYASGHWYFTLKDPDSEIRCAMFRNRNQRVSFVPQDGDAVRVRARVDLYVQRGSYQLVIEDMEPEGRGELLRRLEELKAKLRDEGLFDPQRKQALPPYPVMIGVITSADGAALRDVARTLRRRWPVARLYVYPSRVQGEEAPASLVEALTLASRDNRCDVMILVRGRRQFRRPPGFQPRGSRAGSHRLPDSADFWNRSRDRHLPGRFRCRRPSGHPDCGSGTGKPGRNRI